MRNVVTSVLPPQREITIKINPPMRPTERPVVLTMNKIGLTIEELSRSEVVVRNESMRVMPMAFIVVEGALFGLLGTVKQLMGGT